MNRGVALQLLSYLVWAAWVLCIWLLLSFLAFFAQEVF